MRESSVEKHLTRAVEARGGVALKFVSPGSAGVPDRLVLMPGGRCGLIELKAPSQRPRPLQLRWLERLAGLGIPCGWSADRDEIDRWVAALAGAQEAGLPGRKSASTAPRRRGALS